MRDLEAPGSHGQERVLRECRRAFAEDGSDCIVLGCAGMADFCHLLGRELGVPVVDGVAAGVQLVESLVNLRLSTSKFGELASPPGKTMTGLLAGFALPFAMQAWLDRLGFPAIRIAFCRVYSSAYRDCGHA